MGKKGTRFTVLAMCGSPRYVQTILLSTFIHIQTLFFTPLRNIRTLGGIQQLRGQNFAIFWPPPLGGQFLYPERGQKQTFFDPLPPLILST